MPSEALAQLIREIPASLAVERIDELWVFPPREIDGKENGLVVLSLYGEAGGEGQRQVVTVRYRVERTGQGTRRVDEMAEQGWAPADRISRVIEGVLRRLGDEAEEPRELVIRGDPARWEEAVRSMTAPADA